MDKPIIARREVTNHILHTFKLKADKRLGQNFLIDEEVVRRIVAAAELSEDDTVLEVGPGIGTLTQGLAQSGARVVAVELDKRLLPVLAKTLEGYDNVRIENGDILEVDIKNIVGAPTFKVAANLPYYITTPIIFNLLEQRLPMERLVAMVQKEVADRMQADPGNKNYGALSLAVQYYAEPYIVANVPPNCFMPRPNVGSAVIRLDVHKDPAVKVKDESLMFGIIRASFNQRRKTLQNSISHDPKLGIDKDMVAAVLEEMGLSATVRGEALSLAQFAEFTDRVLSHK